MRMFHGVFEEGLEKWGKKTLHLHVERGANRKGKLSSINAERQDYLESSGGRLSSEAGSGRLIFSTNTKNLKLKNNELKRV